MSKASTSSQQNPQTRKKSSKKSNATKLAHRKFRWLNQLAANPHIPSLGLRACIVISDHASLDHAGSAIIGQDTIATKLDAWRQDVCQALRQVAALGHLEIIRRGRDHANGYRMLLKDEASASKTAADDVGKSPTSNPADDVGESPTSRHDMMSGNPVFDVGDFPTDSPLSSPGAPTEPPERREREENACAFNSPLGGGPPPR